MTHTACVTGIDRYLHLAAKHISFNPNDVEEGKSAQALLDETKVLVIGAGGLGCEILKNLAMSGFKDIHIIDMDTIDISNLNRQFLFRSGDVGKTKAQVASDFIIKRVPGIKVTPHFKRIEEMPEEFYLQFKVVICGLDSIEARRWINSLMYGLADKYGEKGFKPIIDGGAEGFKGNARVILPTISPCLDCSIDLYGDSKTTYPICTIANTPRLPEHCIEWASTIEWPREFPDTKLDGDNPEHITWLFERASERAAQFNISQITYQLTQGVVKNIIPAIASTNAIVAASCTNEALKLVTGCNPILSNYTMYNGETGIYSYTFELEKNDDCLVCGRKEARISFSSESTLEDLIDQLKEDNKFRLKAPTLSYGSNMLYFQSPPSLELETRSNLTKKLSELIESGSTLDVTDPLLPTSLELTVVFCDEN